MNHAGTIAGREHVEADGDRVAAAPFIDGLSTSSIIEKVLAAYRQPQFGFAGRTSLSR